MDYALSHCRWDSEAPTFLWCLACAQGPPAGLNEAFLSNPRASHSAFFLPLSFTKDELSPAIRLFCWPPGEAGRVVSRPPALPHPLTQMSSPDKILTHILSWCLLPAGSKRTRLSNILHYSSAPHPCFQGLSNMLLSFDSLILHPTKDGSSFYNHTL